MDEITEVKLKVNEILDVVRKFSTLIDVQSKLNNEYYNDILKLQHRVRDLEEIHKKHTK